MGVGSVIIALALPYVLNRVQNEKISSAKAINKIVGQEIRKARNRWKNMTKKRRKR
jgi:hypothetical protein